MMLIIWLCIFKYYFPRNCCHQMGSPKHVENSERGRGNPKSKDIFLLRFPIIKMPKETSLVNLLTVNNLGPLWIPGFFKHWGWKTSTPLMTPHQLTTVPCHLIPDGPQAHFPSFWMMQLIIPVPPGKICQLTMEVTEQPPHAALPATRKIFTSFLNFQIPQEDYKLFLTILLMCHPIRQRWPFPHPWALTVMWKLTPSTRDRPSFVEMKREAGSLPGSLSSLSDPLLYHKGLPWTLFTRPVLHLNLTMWKMQAIAQTVSCHFKCHSQLPT